MFINEYRTNRVAYKALLAGQGRGRKSNKSVHLPSRPPVNVL